MQTVAYCTLSPADAVHIVAVKAPRAARSPMGERGDWHYHGIPPPSRIPWGSLLISAGLHVFVLYGFNRHALEAKIPVKHEADLIQMVMPDIKDLEDPAPSELQDESSKAPTVDVPSLVDLPSMVDVNMGLVQPLDLRPPVKADLGAPNLAVVPVNIAHGPRSDGGGLKNIFDLSQLDRVPDPVSQVPPRFPPALKHDFNYAEVLVEFIVDTDGNVRAATVVTSTNSGFDRAAVDGVSKWRFRPGMKAGHRVNTRMRVPIRFRVTEEGES